MICYVLNGKSPEPTQVGFALFMFPLGCARSWPRSRWRMISSSEKEIEGSWPRPRLLDPESTQRAGGGAPRVLEASAALAAVTPVLVRILVRLSKAPP